MANCPGGDVGKCPVGISGDVQGIMRGNARRKMSGSMQDYKSLFITVMTLVIVVNRQTDRLTDRQTDRQTD